MAIDASGKSPAEAAAPAGAGAAVIEVRDLEKTFQVPAQRVTRLKERMLNPFSQREKRELRALRGVSFEVGRGEFFGIVGRNGSGKSTLLKILASIYGSDRGSVRMAGIPAPFIELGVGFNMELTARENVELNGVMMGLTRARANGRLDAVLEFSELEEFVDMKLKNYSSGMLVRLAFSVMVQSDADILLIDEVLAVGDAAFQQKCADVFREMRDSDRTVVLVTHDMGAVEDFCHRAMLLDDGNLVQIGDPGEVARSYLRLNFDRGPADLGDGSGSGTGEAEIRVVDVWLAGADGERTTNIEQGGELRLEAVLEATRDVPGPSVGFMFTNADGVDVFGFGQGLTNDRTADVLEAGERVRLSGRIDNRLASGRHVIRFWAHRNHNHGELLLYSPRLLDFVVFGTEHTEGVVSLAHQITTAPAEPGRD